MKKSGIFRREEKGAVLIITLLLTVALLILMMPFLSKVSGQYKSIDRSFKSYAALNLAEAGVEMAIWVLNNGDITTWQPPPDKRSLTISSMQAASGSMVGDVVITVYEPEGANPVIESTGKVPLSNSDTVDRTLRVELELTTEVLFELALFGSDGINMSGRSKVDAFDSREGNYEGQNRGLDAAIGTNATHFGAITLEGDAELTGNAKIGSEGDPDDILVLDNAEIFGTRGILHEPSDVLPIYAPEGLPYMGEITVDDGGTINITESGEYSSITLDKNANLNITEDVTIYVSGPFILLKNSKFIVEDNIQVDIYLGHSFYMQNGAKFNKKFDQPTNLQIWGTDTFVGDFIAEGGEGEDGGGGDFVMNAKNSFVGALYIPNGNVEINGNMKYYGAILAKTINIDARAQVHYDIALADINTPYSTETYRVISWQEKRLP